MCLVGARVAGVAVRRELQPFRSDGLAPGDPKPTNDRNTAQITADYRFALNEGSEIFAGLWVPSQVPKERHRRFQNAGVNGGWAGQFEGRGKPVLKITGYFSDDKADRKLADGVTDKSKRVGGVRGTANIRCPIRSRGSTALGYERRDRSKFARATEIETGRDKLADVTLGVSWKSNPLRHARAVVRLKNESNIAIYDYTRNEVSSNIRCDFN